MFRQLKKNLATTPIVVLTIGQVVLTLSDTADTLSDMGASISSTLSMGQEMQTGDYYVRQLRDSAPLINDPLLTQCTNALGMRLALHAGSVKTLFTFFLINNDEVNALTLSGGNIVLHSALFRYSDNENQLTSATVHEISHVMRRHLARVMESQKCSVPLTWVGVLDSILLVTASPQAGVAALTDALAGACRGMTSFMQQNEQEVDCIGIQVLQRSESGPQVMPTFLEKLLDQACYSSRPPEILLIHSLPESCLSDARNHASQTRPMAVQSSEDFCPVKTRTLDTHDSGRNQLTDDLLSNWSKGSVYE